MTQIQLAMLGLTMDHLLTISKIYNVLADHKHLLANGFELKELRAELNNLVADT